MGKNMKLIPSPSKLTKPPSFSSSWPWPTCADPKAFSFRAENTTMNSIFVSEEHSASSTESNSASESSRRLILNSELDKEELNSEDAIENVIRGVKSERLFFEPSETSSSSIVGEPADKNKIVSTSEDEHEWSNSSFVVIEMETKDPFLEFKESMKEMVEAHGVENLDGLQELLNCYLRVNGKCNHGDSLQSRISHSISASSPSSFSTSNCKSTIAASGVSSLEDDEAGSA